LDEDDDWEYVEEGPAEIIWKGNEIIVKKKTVRVRKKSLDPQNIKQVLNLLANVWLYLSLHCCEIVLIYFKI